jgi:hypothetical protein
LKKVTIRLPDELSAALKLVASESGRTQSELIRAGIKSVVERTPFPPRPRVPLFVGGGPSLAERVDELLEEGFGRDLRARP